MSSTVAIQIFFHGEDIGGEVMVESGGSLSHPQKIRRFWGTLVLERFVRNFVQFYANSNAFWKLVVMDNNAINRISGVSKKTIA